MATVTNPKGRRKSLATSIRGSLAGTAATLKFYEKECVTVFSRMRRISRPGVLDFRPEKILLALTLAAIIVGTIMGFFLNPLLSDPRNPRAAYNTYIKFPGDIFLRMLKLMIVPLVISSNVSSAATISAKSFKNIGFMAIVYYLLTTIVSVSIGTTLALTLKPGSYIDPPLTDKVDTTEKPNLAVHSLMDLFRNMIPDNIVQATFEFAETQYNHTQVKPSDLTENNLLALNSNITNITADAATIETALQVADVTTKKGANILGLICFSLFFGFGLRKVQEVDPNSVSTIVAFFSGLRKTMIYLVSVIMWFSPIGIMSLIAQAIAQTKNLGEVIQQLGMYTLTVCLGLGIHAFIALPLILRLVGKRNPAMFAYQMLQALITACGTASSLATLPITASCLENRVKVDTRVSRFMLPLGTTVNMDGTALYQMVVIIYVAQGMRVDLPAGTVSHAFVLVVLSSIMTATLPSAGFVSLMITMDAIGLSSRNAAIVLTVDWALDRLRTPVNVVSNAVGVATIAELSKRSLGISDLETINIQRKQSRREEILPDVLSQDVNALPSTENEGTSSSTLRFRLDSGLMTNSFSNNQNLGDPTGVSVLRF